ncbi:MAG: hypothetical protein EOP86_00555 [Verrucomicrobiaceae bacterium]|nr:MAG: hypothetical protein EOP86_00555 [Verrucomicrobiaceae bacterium]
MKRSLPAGLLSCAAALSLTVAAPAQSPAVPAANGSLNYAAAAKHLELGGIFYGFMDVEGDLARFARIGDKFLDIARKQNGGGDIPKNLSASKIIEALGLTTVKAVGASSRTLEGGLYHNRAIVYAPGGQVGLFKLFGGKASPYASPLIAPAGSDLVGETDLNLSALLEISENVLKSIGDERLMQQYQGSLGFPVPVVNLTVKDLISKLDTKVIFFGELIKGEYIPIPNSPAKIPAFKAVLSFDNIDFLFPAILEMTAQAGDKVKVEKGEGFELIKASQPPVPEMPFLQPAVYHDVKSGRILITTNLDYLRSALTATKTLSGDPAFVKATANLPKEGNSLSYVTPKVASTVMEVVTAAMKEGSSASAGGPSPQEMKTIWDAMQELSPLPTTPVAAVRANVADGMLFASNAPNNIKTTIVAGATMVPAMLAVGGFGAYSKVMPGIKAREAAKEEAAKEIEATEETEPAEKPAPAPKPSPAPAGASAKTIRNNLQQIVYSAQTYFLDNPKAKDVTYEKLISTELLFKLDAVSGESYKGLTIKRAGGSVSVKTKSGDPISLSYQPVTD